MYTVDRSKLTEVDVCVCCGRDLRTVADIHVTEGRFYCTKTCAINHIMMKVLSTAKEQAEAIYNDFTEIVTPVDIGVSKERVFPAYSKEHDMTFIVKDTIDPETEEIIETDVVGFYYGEPNEENTEAYFGRLSALFK